MNQEISKMLHKKFDFLIIGSGLAGLYSAFTAAKYGSVALVTKSKIDVSNSYYAQGGIAAVTDVEDFPKLHLEDTLEAGRGLCDYTPVDILVNEGPERIQELIELGMQFDTENGKLSLALEGGHHRRRVLHAGGDSTGREVVKFIIGKVLETPNIKIFENQMIHELLVSDNTCTGALSFNTDTKLNYHFNAKSIILASGGASAIYQRTTNPETTVGDGIALAYRAGSEIADMEFIQFHPSSFYTSKGYTFLISEAVRGEGAYLFNADGERFMTKIHELAELAPRDIVARSIFREMQKDNTEYVRLNLEHLDGAKIKKRFPYIYEKCQESDANLLSEIQIAPAAHYTVGGVKTNQFGETNIYNLYACGELASTGVMGANRLASNSLLECLVFGKRAIEHAIKNRRKMVSGKTKRIEITSDAGLSELFLESANKISRAMNQMAGIIREKSQLDNLTDLLLDMESSFPFKENEYYSIRMQNLLTVCRLITKASLARKESRGGHYRDDYPTEVQSFLAHSIQQIHKNHRFVPVEQKS